MVLLSLFGLASLNASASVCTANGTPAITQAGVFSGDTCAGTDQLVKTCGDTTPIGNAKETIFSVTFGAAINNATFSVNGTGFSPYIGLMSGPACNSLDTCASNFENLGNAGQDIGIGPTTNFPAGQYWIVITDATSPSACGTFNLTVSGKLPVQLQSFSID